MQHIRMYTDGACAGNPGRGGWAAIIIDDNGQVRLSIGEGFRHTTNNRMEIMAVAKGLNELHKLLAQGRDTDIKVTVFSDSQLVVNTMEKGWDRNSNRDLWALVDEAVDLFPNVEFKKVKGHADDTFNNMADELAVSFSQPGKATFIDFGYEKINAVKTETKASAKPELIPVNEPEIQEIRLKNASVKELREVEVYLSNGTIVKIVPLCGGFEQFNCTRAEATITVDIAHRFTKWLNGGKL